jgi:preprotein translocase subunit SecF
MASFFVELWESIFTPGPTPSLLVATNVTFACLQAVLGLLLLFSFSIHFVILSTLCGGLWWSINWFARELKEAQKRQEAEEAKARREAALSAGDDSDTEVEATRVPRTRSTKKQSTQQQQQQQQQQKDAVVKEPAEPVEPMGELRQRLEAAAADIITPAPGMSSFTHGTQSSVSTEDEWERVSEGEKDK